MMQLMGVSIGGLSFIGQIIFALLAIANLNNEAIQWISLALAFNAAGSLFGGVKTPSQAPLEVRATIVTSKPEQLG
ncbi:MAG: hypothetical protein ACRDI3_06505 [Actinomycetota bacterium]